MNLYQFHTHPRQNAAELDDKQIRNLPKAAAQAMSNSAWQHGRRDVPLQPNDEFLLLTDWLNFSYNNWQFLTELAIGAAAEYVHRFSDKDEAGNVTEKKVHPNYADLIAASNLYVSNIGEKGVSKFPCDIVDEAFEMTFDHIKRMKITFAVQDAAKAKWTDREKPEWVIELAKEYNEFVTRKKEAAERRKQREAERIQIAKEKQAKAEAKAEARRLYLAGEIDDPAEYLAGKKGDLIVSDDPTKTENKKQKTKKSNGKENTKKTD